MKQAFLKYKHLWLTLSSWIILGNIFQPAAYFAVILSVFIYFKKERYVELFIGFLFILILSDHVHHGHADPTKFAKTLKGIYLLVLSLVLWQNRKEFSMRNPIFTTLLPFFIFSYFSLIWAINLPIGIQKTVSYTLLYLTIPILFVNIYKLKGKEFLYTLLTFYTLILLIGILFHFIYPSAIRYVQGRYSGLFGNPNGLGGLIVQFFLLFYIIRQYKLIRVSKQELWFVLILIVLSLIMSGSRNAMATIILFLILTRVFRVNFVFGILMLFVSFYLFETITIDIVSIVESAGLEDSLRVQTIETGSGRFIAWNFAWTQIQDYFFMGGGFGQDEQIMRRNYYWLERLGHSGGVHNSYLSMWLDTGLIGLILYFGGMIALIWRGAKNSYLAWPFFLAILFNVNYESWLVASLNPYSIMFLCSLTLLVMKGEFLYEEGGTASR